MDLLQSGGELLAPEQARVASPLYCVPILHPRATLQTLLGSLLCPEGEGVLIAFLGSSLPVVIRKSVLA